MGQVCGKTSKANKCVKLQEVPKNFEEIQIVDPVIDSKEKLNEPEEKMVVDITVQAHTLPETVERNLPNLNQMSNSFDDSYHSLSGLEVDEGEDRTHPLKLFFHDE